MLGFAPLNPAYQAGVVRKRLLAFLTKRLIFGLPVPILLVSRINTILAEISLSSRRCIKLKIFRERVTIGHDLEKNSHMVLANGCVA